jgi:hypothetical protein
MLTLLASKGFVARDADLGVIDLTLRREEPLSAPALLSSKYVPS